MKIYVYPADVAGCGHYRLIWPARSLRHQGVEVTIYQPDSLGGGFGGRVNRMNNELVDVTYPADADIIVIQRPTNRLQLQAIPMLQKQGVVVIIDMDDDLTCIHPGNAAWAALHPRNPANNWANATKACALADLVTVSTPSLATVYKGKYGSAVLPNYVPAEFLTVPHEDSDVIGWAGSTHSHPDDLQAVGSAFAKLNHRFLVVGPKLGVQKALSLRTEPDETGIVAFDHWPTQVTRIGIGIAPLADSRFNRSKSWLKPLEYAALGVPWVASGRPEYKRLYGLGCGLIADRPKAWTAVLRGLVAEPTLRAEMSAAGREVAKGLTIQGQAWRWAEVWLDTYNKVKGTKMEISYA